MTYLSPKSSVEAQEPPFPRKIKNSGWHGCCALSLFGCFHVNRRPASFKPRRPPRRKSYDPLRKSRTDSGARHGYRTEVSSRLSSRERHNEHPTHGIELIRRFLAKINLAAAPPLDLPSIRSYPSAERALQGTRVGPRRPPGSP